MMSTRHNPAAVAATTDLASFLARPVFSMPGVVVVVVLVVLVVVGGGGGGRDSAGREDRRDRRTKVLPVTWYRVCVYQSFFGCHLRLVL